MPEIQIPSIVINILQLMLAFFGAFMVALWLSLIVWTFRDARARSRDPFAILLGTLMAVIFGPLGVLLYFLLRPKVTLAELYERSLEEEALLQDIEERPRCSGCSRAVDTEWIVCPDCHTQLKRTCLNCNNSLHLRWNICPFCGTGVNQAGLHSHSGGHQAQTAGNLGSGAYQPVQSSQPVQPAYQPPAYEPEAEAKPVASAKSDTSPVAPVKVIPMPGPVDDDLPDVEADEDEYIPNVDPA